MNDAQLTDLKQFIDARLSQTEQSLRSEFKADLSAEIHQLSQRMDDGFAAIADIFEHVNTQIDDHEQRLGKLEKQTV